MIQCQTTIQQPTNLIGRSVLLVKYTPNHACGSRCWFFKQSSWCWCRLKTNVLYKPSVLSISDVEEFYRRLPSKLLNMPAAWLLFQLRESLAPIIILSSRYFDFRRAVRASPAVSLELCPSMVPTQKFWGGMSIPASPDWGLQKLIFLLNLFKHLDHIT
jgi:hypothetical protein